MKGVPGFVGERLTQARESRGLTKVALSQMIDISSTALGALEIGKSLPQEDTLARIEAATGFARQFFFRSVPIAVSGPVYWRRQATDAQRSQDKTRQRISWALEAFQELDSHVEFPNLHLPDLRSFPSDWRVMTDEHLESLAEKCREDWGLINCPIPDVTLALENIGIPVLAFEIESQKQSGFMHWSDKLDRPFIGCNTSDCGWSRQRFNLAHELAHVLLHHGRVTEKEVRTPGTYRKIEDQAHRFAAALLFPRDAFVRTIRYPSLEEFAAHKQEWGLSILAQVIRAGQLGLCTSEWVQTMFMQASKKGYRRPLGEPFDATHALEKPRMLRRALDAIEMGSELLLARVQAALPLPRTDQIAIFGRTLQETGSNVFRLKPAN
jgi:Zn-dependent peptidase ImmA (M78 family)/transcriptional regulator with XRE-family HTH domain